MPTTTAAATATTAAAIAAAESEAYIVGMIAGLRAALTRRETMAAAEYMGDQYMPELRELYEARIALYVEALAIARAAR